MEECKVILEPINAHKNNAENDEKKETKSFECQKCGKLYKFWKKLKRHEGVCQNIHIDAKYHCSGCERKFTKEEQLSRHLISRNKNCVYNEIYKKTRRGTQYSIND